MTRAITFRVTGRVQGVSFRAWTRDRAQDLGLTGWVRNEADGSVTGATEGAEADVAAFEAALKEGPSLAGVERVEIRVVSPAGGSAFEIRR